jgi:hypothetical protein
MEIIGSRIKDVARARDAWHARQLAAGFEKSRLDEMTVELERIVREAVWQYRERLLVHDFDHMLLRHRRDTGHGVTDEQEKSFWTEACNRLASKLEFSLESPDSELKKVRNHPRRVAEQAVDADDLAEADDNGGSTVS